MRAVIVCVDFSDILSVTLPLNLNHWTEVLVITSPGDRTTQNYVDWLGLDKVSWYATDAFYRRGAPFNKFLALEEGLSHFGRKGWIMLVDADIVLPFQVSQYVLKQGYLYSFMRRRLLPITAPVIPPEREWVNLPLDSQDPRRHRECMGFCQMFHTSDTHLGEPPWHRLDLPSAALGDSLFQQKWPLEYKVWIDNDVLHLGECARNWCGRVEPYRDGTLPQGSQSRDEQVKTLMKELWPAKMS